ncbi:CBS domain-containing protein [Streptomyces sp. NPDC048231]|uniref:CBS domain-containing protein n=1 Tax=Streptomyces sp. NPDC048231 TaxID=3365519 RepID=UPI0037244070
MTTPAVMARPGWNVVETARTMYRHKVKRLPVVDETGRLIGIVSRSDLLRPFLRGDTAISDEIHQDVLRATLSLPSDAVEVDVRDGVVTLRRRVEERTLIPVIDRCAGPWTAWSPYTSRSATPTTTSDPTPSRRGCPAGEAAATRHLLTVGE